MFELAFVGTRPPSCLLGRALHCGCAKLGFLGLSFQSSRATKADAGGVISGVVAPHRPEYSGKASRQCDGGNEFSAPVCNRFSPLLQGVIAATQSYQTPARLHEGGTCVAVALLGDRSEAATVARALLRRHETKIGAYLVSVPKTMSVIDHGDEDRSNDDVDVGHRHEQLDFRVLLDNALEAHFGACEIRVDFLQDLRHWLDQFPKILGQLCLAQMRDKSIGVATG